MDTYLSLLGTTELCYQNCRQTDVHLARGRSSVEPAGTRLTGGRCEGCLGCQQSCAVIPEKVAESGSGNSQVLGFSISPTQTCFL